MKLYYNIFGCCCVPRNTGNLNSLETCRATMLRCRLRLFVPRIITYACTAEQIFMLQKVNAVPLLQHENLLRAGNRQSPLATQHLLRDTLQENFARVTWPSEYFQKNKICELFFSFFELENSSSQLKKLLLSLRLMFFKTMLATTVSISCLGLCECSLTRFTSQLLTQLPA